MINSLTEHMHRQIENAPRICRYILAYSPTDILTHTHTHAHTHRPERWSREQRVILTRASLVYSEAQCFSQTLIALTGGIPDGLLHCLHAAAHSSGDKSLSAVHHRLRWKNWLKIPRCTSGCSFYSEKLQDCCFSGPYVTAFISAFLSFLLLIVLLSPASFSFIF